jgi:hypothetical protein
MKADTNATVLNFILAVLVILGVIFASLSIVRTRELRQLQIRAQIAQINFMRAQALANDVAAYNATARSVELTRILQSTRAPQSPAVK